MAISLWQLIQLDINFVFSYPFLVAICSLVLLGFDGVVVVGIGLDLLFLFFKKFRNNSMNFSLVS
jgi:hypothetical protein